MNNEKKKVVKDGIIFDTFDTSDDHSGIFAVVNLSKTDIVKVAKCEADSNYLYPPTKRKYTSVVRIYGFVMLALAKWKKRLYLKQIERQERSIEDLKTLDFKQPIFSLFTVQEDTSVYYSVPSNHTSVYHYSVLKHSFTVLSKWQQQPTTLNRRTINCVINTHQFLTLCRYLL